MVSKQTIMRELGLTPQNIERRKRYVGLDASDMSRIASLRDAVAPHEVEITNAFFDHLAGLEEARGLIDDKEVLARAKEMKRAHLRAMLSGKYDQADVEQRIRLAMLFAQAGLDTRVFLGAFQAMLRAIGEAVLRRNRDGALESYLSFNKLAFFDIGVIADVIVYERERVIRQQAEAIRELSTPVLQIRDRMLLLPLIGVIDSRRAQAVTDGLLRGIRAARARVVVMDVTGVATIDSKVANHLLQTVSAARLMGAAVIVTGLSSDVAQSLVALGVAVERFNTVGDLQGGIEEGERMLGYQLAQPTEHDSSLRVEP